MKDKIEEKIEETIGGLVNTAKNSADSLKQQVSLRKKIHELEDSIAVVMYDLGAEVYEGKVSGEPDEEAVDILIDEIKEKRAELHSLYNELNAINGKVACPECRRLTSNEYDFCPFCGTKLYDVVVEEECAGEKSDDGATDAADVKCCCSCCECGDDAAENAAGPDKDECELEVEITVCEEPNASEE